ncbi:MAG TPA: amidohydrolase family protein [Limnochordia bacterium]
MRIDAHQHFWRLDRGDYGWLTPEHGVLYRDYLPDDLRPHLQHHRIDRTILVQAAPTVAETEFLLSLADQEPFIGGVVGWVDLEAPDLPAELDRLARHPKFVGVRPMLQDLADDRWIRRPAVRDALALLEERGIRLDLLTFPRHLPYVLEMLAERPGLFAVIDHLSKPDIRHRQLEPWRSLIREAAAFERVFCKLSGMVTEADHAHWRPDDLKPYVDHVFEVFGPDRVMFGSDWPVCLLAAEYDQVVDALRQALGPRLDPDVERRVFGLNAARFYGID